MNGRPCGADGPVPPKKNGHPKVPVVVFYLI